MSSSDSEDEDYKKLQQAIDPQFEFRPDSLPSTEKKDSKYQTFKENGASNQRFHDWGTTPEFKQYIAKKLAETLDKSIKTNRPCCNAFDAEPMASPDDDNGGIRLLATAKENVSLKEVVDTPTVRPSRRKRRGSTISEDSSDKMGKLASVAVSSEWVLSKRGVFWDDERGSVTVYKTGGSPYTAGPKPSDNKGQSRNQQSQCTKPTKPKPTASSTTVKPSAKMKSDSHRFSNKTF